MSPSQLLSARARVLEAAAEMFRAHGYDVPMDAIAVDVTDTMSLGHEDEFVLLGRQGDELITVRELARRRNTIAWEVLSGMAPRLERVYNRPAGTAPNQRSVGTAQRA